MPLYSENSAALYNPYKFHAYRNAALTTAAAATTKMPFDAERFDTGGNFDTTTNTFTAPVSGFYQFNAAILLQASTTRLFIAFAKGGTEFCRGVDHSAAAYGASNAAMVQLVAGDTITCLYFTQAATALDVSIGGTQFSGFLVSRT